MYLFTSLETFALCQELGHGAMRYEKFLVLFFILFFWIYINCSNKLFIFVFLV
jgi:hypothetical protein